MENLNELTLTDILKLMNDIVNNHDKTKKIIIEESIKLDILEESINLNIKLLSELEDNYITLIDEINKRNAF